MASRIGSGPLWPWTGQACIENQWLHNPYSYYQSQLAQWTVFCSVSVNIELLRDDLHKNVPQAQWQVSPQSILVMNTACWCYLLNMKMEAGPWCDWKPSRRHKQELYKEMILNKPDIKTPHITQWLSHTNITSSCVNNSHMCICFSKGASPADYIISQNNMLWYYLM